MRLPSFLQVHDHDRFEKLASGLNKLVLTVAMGVGACWTLYIYKDVPRREKLKAQSNLILTVNAHQLRVPGDAALYVQGTVHIENRGSRNTRMNFDDSGQVQIARARFDSSGYVSFPHVDKAAIYMWPERPPKWKTSLFGGADDLPFVHRVSSAGLYLVSFSATRDDIDIRMAGGNGSGDKKLSWTGVTYVVVSDSAVAPTTAR